MDCGKARLVLIRFTRPRSDAANLAIAWKLFIVITVWLTVGWLAGYLRPLDASLGLELPAWVETIGAAVLFVGAGGVLACGMMLSTCGIGTLRGKERLLPKDFLTSGPFKFVRNPMSLASVVLMVGIALWHRSTLALVIAAGLFFIFHVFVVFVEEPGLEKRFGDSYREYQRQVPRWIPRWSPWSGGVPETPCDRAF
jgi:protein-S-isoprenylcysteine O-methyltransferase Ste14